MQIVWRFLAAVRYKCVHMLERIARDGVVVFVSPVLREIGVPHAFSTRIGGVSAGVFSSLNLGNPNGCPVQDDLANVRENYRRFFDAAGCAGRQWRRAHQVHGRDVVRARGDDAPGDHWKADALITDDPRCAVSIRVADCVPILIARTDGKLVAAVHAGWRGVVVNVVAAALQAMGEGEFAAAIGPCIGRDAFEVGPEVVAEFRRAFAEDGLVRKVEGGKGYVDLREAVRRQLVAAGLRNDRIDATDRCTFQDSDEFFSHRRDAGATGRMAGVIGVRPSISSPATMMI